MYPKESLQNQERFLCFHEGCKLREFPVNSDYYDLPQRVFPIDSLHISLSIFYVIMATSSITQARGTSRYYQNSFAQSVSKAVVGKKTSTLSLSAIGGASLTTHAFTQYIGSL